MIQIDPLPLFEDAGWDYIARLGGWYYFKIEAKRGSSPELYSDNASKIKMYSTLRLVLIIVCAPYCL